MSGLNTPESFNGDSKEFKKEENSSNSEEIKKNKSDSKASHRKIKSVAASILRFFRIYDKDEKIDWSDVTHALAVIGVIAGISVIAAIPMGLVLFGILPLAVATVVFLASEVAFILAELFFFEKGVKKGQKKLETQVEEMHEKTTQQLVHLEEENKDHRNKEEGYHKEAAEQRKVYDYGQRQLISIVKTAMSQLAFKTNKMRQLQDRYEKGKLKSNLKPLEDPATGEPSNNEEGDDRTNLGALPDLSPQIKEGLVNVFPQVVQMFEEDGANIPPSRDGSVADLKPVKNRQNTPGPALHISGSLIEIDRIRRECYQMLTEEIVGVGTSPPSNSPIIPNRGSSSLQPLSVEKLNEGFAVKFPEKVDAKKVLTSALNALSDIQAPKGNISDSIGKESLIPQAFSKVAKANR